ncbi:STAS domain-containing protein [bacterium]|nr:STAS domain-containing protein [bacterium]
MDTSFPIESIDGKPLIHLVGDLDTNESSQKLKEVIGSVETTNQTAFYTFDLSAVGIIDTGAIGTLLCLSQKCRSKGGLVCLKGANGYVKQLLQMLKLETFFAIEE